MRSLTAKILLVLSGLAAGALANASSFPTRPVSLLVPYPAGAASDITARTLQGPIGKALESVVVVENLGGANGIIGANRVLHAPSDGYYIFQGSPNELILAGLMNKSVKYTPQDFEMLTPVAISPYVLVTRSDLKVNNIDELVELGQHSALPLSYGSGGVGSMIHLVSAAFGNRANLSLLHVPYKGGAPLLAELSGGQIDFAFLPMQANLPDLERDGRLKIIATLEPNRLPSLPNVPSVDESNTMKQFNYTIWTAYMVKKGTPEAIKHRIKTAIDTALKDPTAKKTLEAQSKIIYDEKTPEESAHFYAQEITRLTELFQSIGLQPE